MDTPIRMPFPERRRDNLQITRPAMPNGAVAFAARSFVKLSGAAPDQVLIACVTGDTLCYGWCPDRSHLSTETPPDALYKAPNAIAGVYNYLHWPFALQDTIFVMNITNTAGTPGQAGSAPQLSSVLVGQVCKLQTISSGGVLFQCLDTTVATTPFAKIVGIVPGQSMTDYNGLVYAEVLAANIEGIPAGGFQG